MTTKLTQALKRSLLSVFVFVILVVASQLQADSQTVPQRNLTTSVATYHSCHSIG
jgi:hypothetical protein